ncbi:DUF4153 domain-containing protein [Ornithinimicrobium cryptoxanthini]|uniref:histidine kinase n=1 Tax=Ornithinimicrobium cryptoxanthini TaxID=2934161 RepID=A0ABY4YE72_9MICO|nr:DUF4153 domain-containing protein [Ornithinimicrobium cryptoxanthini]USQ75073.1 DUF4173 domain-containing protein [Ornithinimicrobium cryptoxanthini]
MADLDPERPLDPVGSIKIKIGLLVALSILVAAVVLQVGNRAGVPAWLTLPVTLAAALGVTQWLARGMTAPLREMTTAAGRMAGGDYSSRVTATSADEVGQLGRAFNSMVGDLATADQQRRELVATVSHELRTPLAGQRALLENLVDGVVQPDDAALGAALSQSERLSNLVEDLLDASRLDGGAVRLDLAEVAVAELLDAAVRESAIGGRPVRYEVSVQPPDLHVEADAARLHQVVANLLDNASRHSPTDGVVRVSAQDLGGDRWALEVADRGPGIPAERSEAIFARFGTADPTGGGSGLGLAIARWVCELHGGTIGALPPDGGSGARIRAELPLHPDQTPSAPSPERTIMTMTPEQGAAPASGVTAVAVQAAPSSATPTDAPNGSVIASMFGHFWPERDSLRTAPGALLGSVAVGLLGAIILPERNFGIGTFLVLLAAGALVLRLSVHRGRLWALASATLCVGLGALVFLRAAEWLAVLGLLVSAALVTTALTDARRPLAMIAGGASWVLSGLRGLPLLGRTLTATSRHHVLWPVVRTAAISLILLVVFVGLFASGDALFGSWVSGILPDVRIADTLVLRAFTWFMIGGIVLAACYLALSPPAVETVGPGDPRPVTRAWEWQVPVGVVIAVFAAFLVAQATAMWGGHDYLQQATGLTYAEYVHQGFGQLVVATLLTLVTIAVAVRKAPRATARERQVLRVLLGVLCALTLVVVASALYRMSLYQEAYGYTVLRVLVDAFELWLGLVVVLVLIAGVRLRGSWLPRATLLSAAVFLLVIGLMNPEAWVAQRNIDRYAETGRVDLSYLASLGPDATPVIVDGLPEELARCVVGAPEPAPQDDPLEWNLGRARADAVVPGGGTDRVGRPGCPTTIGE